MASCGAVDAESNAQQSTTSTTEASVEEVQEAHEYLQAYGYFESEALRQQFPEWNPVVGGTVTEPRELGEQTRAALRELQRRAHIDVTGDVDAATLTYMRTPRCGVPDSFDDGVDKWAPWTDRGYQDDLTLTYSIDPVYHPDPHSLPVEFNLSTASLEAAMKDAFDAWSRVSLLRFTRVSSGGQIHITADDLGLKTLGQTGSSGTLAMNIRKGWTKETFKHILMHEVGHWLGFHHSSIASKTLMWPTDAGATWFQTDERQALSVSPYTKWVTMSGAFARDIGVGSFSPESVWAIGTLATGGGYTIHRYDAATGSWPQVEGGAARIDVAGHTPWVVNSGGGVFKRSGITALDRIGTGWREVRNLLARDIGGHNNEVWAVSRTATDGGYTIHHYVAGDNWAEVDGGAVRIDVGPDGVPWIVDDEGKVYSREGVSLTNEEGTGWKYRGDRDAKDISVGQWGAVWISAGELETGGYSLYMFNKQSEVDADEDGDIDAPARNTWVKAGTGHNISVGLNELPWITEHSNSGYRVLRRTY